MKEEKKVPAMSGTKTGESAGSGGYFANFDFSKLEASLEEMFKNGVHFGHHKSRKNPKAAEYVFGTRNGINIIDLEKTSQKLREALDFVTEIVASGQEILFIGTKKQAKNIIESAAKRSGMPYVNERWLGGTFSNFSVISERTKYLREGQEKMEKGEYSQYTKFEKMKIAEELEKMEKKMGGIKNMNKLPGAIFVTGVIEDNLAIKEARAKNVPIVAIVDSNVSPEGIDYPIPANDDAVSSLRLIVGYVAKAVLEGKAKFKSLAKNQSEED